MTSALLLLVLAAPVQAEDERKKILKLIEQMNDDSFEVRDKASKAAVEIGHPALEALKQAAHYHEAPEVRGRAQDAVLAIYRREIPVRKGTIPLSGIHFFDKGGVMLATSCDTGLAALVIPRGKATVEVAEKGIEITSVEEGAETKILYTVFDVQVTLKGKVFKGFGEDDLKARHPDAHAALIRVCRMLPLDFADAQVITDPSRPQNQTVNQFINDLEKSYGNLIAVIRGSALDAGLKEPLATELEAEKTRRIAAARK